MGITVSDQAILFDLDGVLVDSRAPITSCINHALATQGRSTRPSDALLKFIGPPLAGAFAELTGESADSELVGACVRTYREVYGDVAVRETSVVPGIIEVLEALRPRHRLAVATSKPRVFAEPLLDALGLRRFFEFCAGPELSPLGEEKAATIAAALAELGSSRAIMVGDRWLDVVGARACRIPAIAVAWGIGSVDELCAARPDALIHTPDELPAAVAELVAAGDRQSARSFIRK